MHLIIITSIGSDVHELQVGCFCSEMTQEQDLTTTDFAATTGKPQCKPPKLLEFLFYTVSVSLLVHLSTRSCLKIVA